MASGVDKRRRSGKLRADMRWLANFSGITFALYFLWKVALLLFTSQPVPANDSFFYDGPVVNYLLHGDYCNPSLAMVLPISGNEVFCAYPPLYQCVLLGWMKCFGTSELAAMWFHVALLGLYGVTVLAIFRELKLSPIAVNIAGLFLFGITFHDRPDSLAQCFGALAVLACVRGMPWPTAALLVLTFCTSVQLGGIYAVWIGLITIATTRLNKVRFPTAAILTFIATLIGLIGLVKFGFPHLWEGFQEHLKITPSVTGIRLPAINDLLKIGRAIPGIVVVVFTIAWLLHKRQLTTAIVKQSAPAITAICGLLTLLGLLFGCLFILTPNTILMSYYAQPIIVGCLLGFLGNDFLRSRPGKYFIALFVASALVVSIRGIGMSTWGILCARDISHSEAMTGVRRELDDCPAGSTVLLSSSYLYEGATRTNLVWLHSDWHAPATTENWELRGLMALKPKKIVLNQLDYYRHYETAVAQFRRERGDVEVRITNMARVQPPDAIRPMRKVVQHISWAPVIVEFTWPSTTETK